jgi:diguanylate cyclase (GGDEF)-like protein
MKYIKKPVVLIIDDSTLNLDLISKLLISCDIEPIKSKSHKDAFEKASTYKPDLILLDVILPEVDGFEMAKKFKSDYETKDLPIIFITAKDDISDIIEGFEAGAVDYVTKPFHTKELISRVKTHLELKLSKDQIKNNAKELSLANESLRKMFEEVERSSKTDFLTGLYNRKYLYDRIEIEKVRFKRNKKPFSIILSDIDFFKAFNDNYGHNCGDYILKELSNIFLNSSREQDIVSRWGGEEFLFLLPETPIEGTKPLIKRVCNNLKNSNFQNEGHSLTVTTTFGVATYEEQEDIDVLIRRADDALYLGKKNGRNCAVYNAKNVIDIENN